MKTLLIQLLLSLVAQLLTRDNLERIRDAVVRHMDHDIPDADKARNVREEIRHAGVYLADHMVNLGIEAAVIWAKHQRGR